jgi:hypothetical protein
MCRGTHCHRALTIELQNFTTLRPTPTLLPPPLTAKEIISLLMNCPDRPTSTPRTRKNILNSSLERQ